MTGKAESADNFGGKLRQQAVPDSVVGEDAGEYGPTLSTTAALIRKNIQKTTSASTKAATRPRTDTSSSRLRTGLETTTEMPEDPKVLDEMMLLCKKTLKLFIFYAFRDRLE